MVSKTWTYEELTNAAIIQIERCAKQATLRCAEGDVGFAKQYAEWAYGVCELWHEQTKDHHPDKDRERLIDMVKAVEQAAIGRLTN